jgi:GxxExxY protein
MRDLDDITGAIVDTALQMHRDLGPGLLESVYEAIVARALERRGLRVERQKVIRIEYQGMVFEEGFRADLVVETQVIVEIKSVDQLARQHAKQLLTYLKLANIQVGLLINFGAPTLRQGLRRIVNGYEPRTSSAAPREPERADKCQKETSNRNPQNSPLVPPPPEPRQAPASSPAPESFALFETESPAPTSSPGT